jgi:hypothetical protein
VTPEKESVWWVSWQGEVRQAPGPLGLGWAPVIAPYDTPTNFDPEEDYWLHHVRSPLGKPHYVQLVVNPEGGWEARAVLSQAGALELAKGASETYGVSHDDMGRFWEMERWR